MARKRPRYLCLYHTVRVTTDPGAWDPVTVHLLDADELDRPHELTLSASDAAILVRQLQASLDQIAVARAAVFGPT